MPDMVPVESSNIHSIGWESGDLYIGFHHKSGTPQIYMYAGVPEEVFQQFQQAPSKGKFFRSHIQGVLKVKGVKL